MGAHSTVEEMLLPWDRTWCSTPANRDRHTCSGLAREPLLHPTNTRISPVITLVFRCLAVVNIHGHTQPGAERMVH